MNEKESLVGKKFGYWTVIDYPVSIFTGKKMRNFTKCKCVCGKERSIRPDRLINKITTSCGCKKIKQIKTGDIFGNFEIISEAYSKYNEKRKYNLRYINVKCIKCGNKKILPICQLENRKKSKQRGCCKCYGLFRKRILDKKLYSRWQGIKNRCYNPKCKSYKIYGERGIRMCDNWFNSFENFQKWVIENGHKDGYDLAVHRKDPNADYSPQNCELITSSENAKRIVSDRENKIKELKLENWNLIQENLRLKVQLELSNSIHNPLIINPL